MNHVIQKAFFILPLLLAPTLPAQEVTPQMSDDLAIMLGYECAAAIRGHEEELGKAFDRPLYVRVLAEILCSGQELPEPEKSDCPESAAAANKYLHLFAGDFDTEKVLSEAERLLQCGDWESSAFERDLIRVQQRLARDYRPVIRARERKREQALLQANARREGVTVLPNGIQYEIEPGDDSIRDITRGTRETGVRFFTRTTDDTEFDELPEPVRAVADSLPRAKSWTIYVPGEVILAAEEAQQREAEAEQTRREDKLRNLLGVAQPEKTVKRTAEPKAVIPPLLKLTVWKDDPDHPAEVQPDVSNRVF